MDGTLSYLPAPTKNDQFFIGWFTQKTGGVEVTEETVFSNQTTIYAHWSELYYIDKNGKRQALDRSTTTTLDNDSFDDFDGFRWIRWDEKPGWYIVYGKVSGDRIDFIGDTYENTVYNIVLADDCTLNIEREINVLRCTVNFYAQSKGNGLLKTTSICTYTRTISPLKIGIFGGTFEIKSPSFSTPGIGSVYDASSGDIDIFGGKITVRIAEGENPCGIGAGWGCGTVHLTIGNLGEDDYLDVDTFNVDADIKIPLHYTDRSGNDMGAVTTDNLCSKNKDHIIKRGKTSSGIFIKGGDQSVTCGDDDFTLTGDVTEPGIDGRFTWESSNPGVAVIDPDTGEVTIRHAGETQIKASYVSDIVDGSAIITLTVNKKADKVIDDITKQTERFESVIKVSLDPNLPPDAGAIDYFKIDGEITKTGNVNVSNVEVDQNGNVCAEIHDAEKGDTFTIPIRIVGQNYDFIFNIVVALDETTAFVTNPPVAITGLVFNGNVHELITEGEVIGGTLYYALGDENGATETYTTSKPTATAAGTYYVWYKAKGDANHNDTAPDCKEVTIAKAESKSETIKTVEVQNGEKVTASVNLKAYLGKNATVTNITTQESQTETLTFSDISMGEDKYTLNFKVSSTGGTGSIVLTAETDNYKTHVLTIPVAEKAKTTEVKLDETAGDDTAVQGVEVNGLEAFTNGQTGTTVKVGLDVKTEKEESVNDSVATKIKNAVALIFSGVESSNVKKEYLDISVKKTVDNGTPTTVTDVGRVIEIVVKYDLAGKFNPVVIREHDGSITKFTALSLKPDSGFKDGTFYVDTEHNIIYIYTQFFSTYSIAYAKTASYTVKFDAKSRSGVDPIVVQDGGVINPLPITTRRGYSFDGWYNGSTKWTESTAVTGDMTLTAGWTSNGSGGSDTGGGGGGTAPTPTPTTSYTVSFDANGGSGTMASQTITGTAVLNTNAFTREDHTFTGWNTKADGSGTVYADQASVTPTADMTLYAQWKTETEEHSDNVLEIDEEKGIATVKDDVSGGAEEVPLYILTEGLIYRMYDSNRGEHFYTKNPEEAELLVQLGWIHESGSDFAVVSATEEDAVPVYRLYNPNCGGMHFYTDNVEEAKYLNSIGWNYEGISHYVYNASSTKGTP